MSPSVSQPRTPSCPSAATSSTRTAPRSSSWWAAAHATPQRLPSPRRTGRGPERAYALRRGRNQHYSGPGGQGSRWRSGRGWQTVLTHRRIPCQGISGTVAATGEVVNIPDAYEDSRFDRSADESTGEQRSAWPLAAATRLTDAPQDTEPGAFWRHLFATRRGRLWPCSRPLTARAGPSTTRTSSCLGSSPPRQASLCRTPCSTAAPRGHLPVCAACSSSSATCRKTSTSTL